MPLSETTGKIGFVRDDYYIPEVSKETPRQQVKKI